MNLSLLKNFQNKQENILYEKVLSGAWQLIISFQMFSLALEFDIIEAI